MIGTMITVAVMTVLFVWMMNRGRFGLTRQMALIPLAVVFAELITAGVLNTALFPVLTAILFAARLTIVGCCVGAMKLDAHLAKQRAKERAERRARLRRAQMGTIQGRGMASDSRTASARPAVALVHTA